MPQKQNKEHVIKCEIKFDDYKNYFKGSKIEIKEILEKSTLMLKQARVCQLNLSPVIIGTLVL